MADSMVDLLVDPTAALWVEKWANLKADLWVVEKVGRLVVYWVGK